MTFNNNPNNSFRYDMYVPDIETEPLYNAFNIDNMKEKLEVNQNYEEINGQYSLNNLNVSNHTDYIQRLERLENNNFDNQNSNNVFNPSKVDYQQQYFNYLVNNNKYKKNLQSEKYNKLYKLFDSYLYMFLIVILFIITMFQKNRIDTLNDLLSFKMNNNFQLSTKGL
jgi:ATP-dependent Zn protease